MNKRHFPANPNTTFDPAHFSNDREVAKVRVKGSVVGIPDGRILHACSLCGMRFQNEADFDSHRHHELGPWHGAYVGPIPKENNDV